ncbi:MAG TPA: hypothetical protein VEK08_01015 [Planctomycetota bacterium]|nr:hypothetical protein [Planctomycetota bacterium]
MHAPKAAIEPDQKAPLARSAVLIQALALACAAVVVLLAVFVSEPTGETLALLTVASSAAVVGTLWSFVLALRAILSAAQGMLSRWAIAVFYFCLLEMFIATALLWEVVIAPSEHRILNTAVYFGVPVFGPFFTLALAIAGPLAFGYCRRIQAQEIEQQIKPRQQRALKEGCIFFAAMTAALGIILLPGPLYLLVAASPQFFNEAEFESSGWAGWWSDAAPDFIRDSMESLVHAEVSTDNLAGEYHFHATKNLLQHGKVSPQRLWQRFESESYPANMFAWVGLKRVYPEVATVAARSAVHNIALPRMRHYEDAVAYLARHGSLEDLRFILDEKQTGHAPNWSRRVLLEHVEDNPHFKEAMPELLSLARQRIALDSVLPLLARHAPREDVLELWKGLSEHEHEWIRNEGAQTVVWCVLRDVLEPVKWFLQDDGKRVARGVMTPLARRRDGLHLHMFRNPKNLNHLKLIKTLREAFDYPDTEVRVGAMAVLGDIFSEGEGDGLRDSAVRKLSDTDLKYKVSIQDPPEWTAAELKEILRVANLVDAWLAKAE